jgi:hypothetical protein
VNTAKGEWIVVWKVAQQRPVPGRHVGRRDPAVSPLVDAVIPKGGSVTGYQRLATAHQRDPESQDQLAAQRRSGRARTQVWSGGTCAMNPADCVTLTASTANQYFKHTFNGRAAPPRSGAASPPRSSHSARRHADARVRTTHRPRRSTCRSTRSTTTPSSSTGRRTKLSFKIAYRRASRRSTSSSASASTRSRPPAVSTTTARSAAAAAGATFPTARAPGSTAAVPRPRRVPSRRRPPPRTATGPGTLHLNNDGAYPTVFKVTKNGGPETRHHGRGPTPARTPRCRS